MTDLQENEIFFRGLVAGICIYQQKIISVHNQKEPLKVGNNLFYLENGKERLRRILDEICK